MPPQLQACDKLPNTRCSLWLTDIQEYKNKCSCQTVSWLVFNHLEVNCPAGVTTALHWFGFWTALKMSKSQETIFCFGLYLSGQRHFDGHRDQLCQETAVEGHHEHHRVVVGENECNLRGVTEKIGHIMCYCIMPFLISVNVCKTKEIVCSSYHRQETRHFHVPTSNGMMVLYL